MIEKLNLFEIGSKEKIIVFDEGLDDNGNWVKAVTTSMHWEKVMEIRDGSKSYGTDFRLFVAQSKDGETIIFKVYDKGGNKK